jgi:general secretion pathway protein H
MRVRGAELGMTLVEMIVVLAIIAIMAGATVLGMGAATRGPSVEAEARRLATRLQSAADEAMVDEYPLALTWDKHSYGFLHWDGRAWRPGEDEGHASHSLPAGMTIDMGKATPPMLVGVEGSGIPAIVTLNAPQDRWVIVYDGLTVSPVPAPLT